MIESDRQNIVIKMINFENFYSIKEIMYKCLASDTVTFAQLVGSFLQKKSRASYILLNEND